MRKLGGSPADYDWSGEGEYVSSLSPEAASRHSALPTQQAYAELDTWRKSKKKTAPTRAVKTVGAKPQPMGVAPVIVPPMKPAVSAPATPAMSAPAPGPGQLYDLMQLSDQGKKLNAAKTIPGPPLPPEPRDPLTEQQMMMALSAMSNPLAMGLMGTDIPAPAPPANGLQGQPASAPPAPSVATPSPELYPDMSGILNMLALSQQGRPAPAPLTAPPPSPDPKKQGERAANIAGMMSIVPLLSLLGGGGLEFGQRAFMPAAAAAISGDTAFQANQQQQEIERVKMLNLLTQQQNENLLSSQKLQQSQEQAAADIASRGEIERVKTNMTLRDLKLKEAEFRDRSAKNLRESEDSRAKFGKEYMEMISLLEPEAQVATVSQLAPDFRAFYGIDLPKDGRGNMIPLTRRNPNEPSSRMMNMRVLEELYGLLGKNPDSMRPGGQANILSQINWLESQMGLEPGQGFTQIIYDQMTPADRARNALLAQGNSLQSKRLQIDQAGLGISRMQGQAALMNANTNRQRLGLDRDKFERGDEAPGAEMTRLVNTIQRIETGKRLLLQSINNATKGRWDSLRGDWMPNTPEELKQTEPQVRAWQGQLQQADNLLKPLYGQLQMLQQAGGMMPAPAGPAGQAPAPAPTPGAPAPLIGGGTPAPAATPDPSVQQMLDLANELKRRGGSN